MSQRDETYSLRLLSVSIFLGWLSMLGIDFLLLAGLLTKAYVPFLLLPAKTFQVISLTSKINKTHMSIGSTIYYGDIKIKSYLCLEVI